MYKILEKRTLNPNVKLMRIENDLIHMNAQPGQFVIIRVKEGGERIPLTIFDFDEQSISIIYQVVGATTSKLDHLNVGEHLLDIVGPLGTATDLDNVSKVIVVGGGVGCAIAHPIAKKLYNNGVEVTSIVGFRNSEFVILEKEFQDCSNHFILTTDDGSAGVKGFVTDSLRQLLEKCSYDKVFAIGPVPMMKFVSLLTKEFNTKTIVSLNSIMVDGTGMCGGCRVTVDGESKFACVDGPDFDGHLVDFDQLTKRNSVYNEFERTSHCDYCKLLEVNGLE